MLSKKVPTLKNEQGFSLVEILVAFGVGVVLLGFVSDMLIRQYKDAKLLSQKLETIEFKNNLISIFANPANCSCQFANNATNPNLSTYSLLKFDSNVTNGSESIDVTNLYSGCAGGVNPPYLLAANSSKLYGTNDLIVDKVRIVNLKPNGSNPNEWQGQWEISFVVGSNSLARSLRPISLSQKFDVDRTIPSATRISACQGLSFGAGTNNYLSKWTAIPGVLDDSGIFQDPISGNIGIRTALPQTSIDINGEVKIGSTGLGCNGTTEGTIRYNAVLKTTEFCNGVSWQAMGVAPVINIRTNTATAVAPLSISVSCNAGEVLAGGGGSCTSAMAYALVGHSVPNANSWDLGCGHSVGAVTVATVYAICAKY